MSHTEMAPRATAHAEERAAVVRRFLRWLHSLDTKLTHQPWGSKPWGRQPQPRRKSKQKAILTSPVYTTGEEIDTFHTMMHGHMTIEAVVIRADGTVEDRGVVSEGDF